MTDNDAPPNGAGRPTTAARTTGADDGAASGGGPGRAQVPPVLEATAAWSWRIVVIAVALWVVGTVLIRLSVVVLPVIIALILATIAIPPATWLRRRGVPPAASAGIVVLGGLSVLVGFVVLVAPSFATQVSELSPTIEDGVDTLLEFLATVGFDQQRISDLLAQSREALAGSGGQIVQQVAGGLALAVQAVAGLLLAIVLLFFVIKDAEDMQAWARDRLPQGRRDVFSAIGGRAWNALGGYVRGTATIALVDATAIGIGLAIIGVPLVLPLALLVFLGAFLPVIGAAIAGIVAVLVALASGGLQDALIALAIVIGVQQLEGNVLQPMIMRRAVSLHPVVVLVALAIGATLAGIVGAFLSLPAAAVASAVGNELRLRNELGQGPLDPEPSPT
jgi:predicted PurR-regulated permease PerM